MYLCDLRRRELENRFAVGPTALLYAVTTKNESQSWHLAITIYILLQESRAMQRESRDAAVNFDTYIEFDNKSH